MTTTDTERAYLRIKDKIIKTELMPGAVIKETDLMETLSFGRTPIREALKQLQIEDLVVVKPRRGIFVSDVAITDLLQLFEIRVELEALSIRLAIKRITAEQLTELNNLAKAYAQIDTKDKRELIELDSKFHFLIAEASRNKFLRHDIEHYYNLSTRIWYLVIDLTTPEDIDIKAHFTILKAIEAGEADKAVEAITRHIKDFHTTMKRCI